MAGTGLMSAFLPAVLGLGWQELGVGIGVALIAVACVGAAWHGFNDFRQKRGKPRLKLEPNYLVIFGLAVALICVAWQFFGGATGGSRSAVQQEPEVPSQDVETHLSLQFGSGIALPVATDLANIWRWYALANIVNIMGPQGQTDQIKTWNIFVTLDKPIDLKQVTIKSSAKLPSYEVKDTSNKTAVIAFI